VARRGRSPEGDEHGGRHVSTLDSADDDVHA
jgi:hypothetical protein